MKIFRLLTACIFLHSLVLASGGSLYSRMGLGEFNYNLSARRIGMGGLGYSVIDKDFLGYTNPAAWNKLETTRFEIGYVVDATRYSNNTSTVFNSNSYFNGMLFGFPISKQNGISLIGGIVPYSTVGYEVTEAIPSNLVEDYKATYYGNGGIYQLFFGSSITLPFNFSLGASFEYYNGNIQNGTEITFADTSTFKDISYARDVSYHGIGYKLGLISSDLSKALNIDFVKELRLGISFSSKTTLKADSANVYGTTIGSYTGTSGSLEAILPARIGFGTSFKLADKYLFTLDYMHQAMSDFTWDSRKQSNLQDVSKYSFGMEYRPDLREEGFLRQVMLRTGISYETTPYKVSGTSIDQLTLYAGCSFPLSYGNSIDVGFQYAMRGTFENNLLKENLFKLNLGISIGDLWFIQSER